MQPRSNFVFIISYILLAIFTSSPGRLCQATATPFHLNYRDPNELRLWLHDTNAEADADVDAANTDHPHRDVKGATSRDQSSFHHLNKRVAPKDIVDDNRTLQRRTPKTTLSPTSSDSPVPMDVEQSHLGRRPRPSSPLPDPLARLRQRPNTPSSPEAMQMSPTSHPNPPHQRIKHATHIILLPQSPFFRPLPPHLHHHPTRHTVTPSPVPRRQPVIPSTGPRNHRGIVRFLHDKFASEPAFADEYALRRVEIEEEDERERVGKGKGGGNGSGGGGGKEEYVGLVDVGFLKGGGGGLGGGYGGGKGGGGGGRVGEGSAVRVEYRPVFLGGGEGKGGGGGMGRGRGHGKERGDGKGGRWRY
ncbi:hypothetical protein MMC10_006338 [Thelotrema lepadinum]|nr:hypothetical protein [Thelotrema lepadinum]